MRSSVHLPPPRAERNTREHSREYNLGSPSLGPFDLRIRPRKVQAMPDQIVASKVISDNQFCRFLMILVWPGTHIFQCIFVTWAGWRFSDGLKCS